MDHRDDIPLMDDEDDLEFYITFPTPTPEGFVVVNSPEPVVFLLGWAGCVDKHLAKYSKIYEDVGCITIRYTAPAEYVMFDTEKLRPLARKLLDLIPEMSLDENPVLFHVFSNNGASVYQFMSELLRTDPQYSQILTQTRGQVYDSGPGPRTGLGFVRASKEIFAGRSFWFRLFVPFALLAYAYVMHSWKRLLNVLGLSEYPVQCYDYLMAETVAHPLMYIYSHGDNIILAEYIEALADTHEQKGGDVTKVCFDASPHVQHFRVHRESYIANVRGFLNKCLKK